MGEARDNSRGAPAPYWTFDKKIPLATVWAMTIAIVSCVWYFSGIAHTQQRHGEDIAALYQQIAPVQANSAKLAELQATMSDMRARVESEATHERRISMLEAANAEFARALSLVGDRLARIEAKQDALLNRDHH
jgi:hypothetical protein